MAAEHNFGTKCRLAPIRRPWAQKEDEIPPVEAQYFYSSPISIDDPLSPSLIAGSAEAKSARGPLRPFSRGDNNSLEKVWLTLASDKDRDSHMRTVSSPPNLTTLTSADAETLAVLILSLSRKHAAYHPPDPPSSRPGTPTANDHDTATTATATVLAKDDDTAPIPVCCPSLPAELEHELAQFFCPIVRSRYRPLRKDVVIQEIMMRVWAAHVEENELAAPSQRLRAKSWRNPGPQHEKDACGIRQRLGRDSVESSSLPRRTGSPTSPLSQSPAPLAISVRPAPTDDGVTGKPFARMSSSTGDQHSAPASLRNSDPPAPPGLKEKRHSIQSIHSNPDSKPQPPQTGTDNRLGPPTDGSRKRAVMEVPVGVSRLHMVSLPKLQMKPIYWSPVNDVAVVLRATWFYSETMVPVDPIVANQLEAGFRELRPHTETWRDELRCAVEVGPLGEEKVVHRLWPKPHGKTDNSDSNQEPIISQDPDCASRCYRGEAATEGHFDGVDLKENAVPSKPFSNYHVIYKDFKDAYLLKPSLRPSSYYGRKPVAKIAKGHSVGIPVRRGFDWDIWYKAHAKKGRVVPQSPNQPASVAAETQESTGADACEACKQEKERGQVTDLVFVAHGIGQKFAERVESFHFTHAINGFRREINIELGSPAVKSVLRQGQNGIMVLPINWRHTLSFEDGGPMREEDKSAYMPEGFALKDIEPGTIPAVRSIISDVMFDIPFYMSHHKHKMIEALVTEANRVYRLWCRNNPGFADNGRVHLIGHSLGSAMALEVLSKQPTETPRLNLEDPQQPLQTSFFEFDTKNLFLLGSPAGFFLLLERGALMPRKGRLKPGADPLDVENKDIVGETGFFGCLAVDNVYNILAKEDPIAYLLNGTIDPAYATNLRVAYVPSAAASIFKSMGDAVRNLVPGLPPPTTATHQAHAAPIKPSTARLPSQLELEVHDFTREDIAEKRAHLLNDNGQIDFYLRSGGGPLEIQYLNMLSAHTSYWVHQDLIRMLCMEIGREPGREHSLPSLRAIKTTRRMMTASLTSH
ncbi:ddhd domain-containing protein [Zalerion maritima]|uniref:Ddhd domain-containing protein n=1 Tax=Zalerion maritima TaxID=339359 RepID=A0AAD5WRI6_9PEZI|nr:ddhd domain-containing protein [Zalerion maritima]